LGVSNPSLRGKQTKILGDNSTIAVTIHSVHEWIYEANEKYNIEHPEWLWQVAHYEQYSCENADLVFFPSHYLTTRVRSYGWNVEKGNNMPNYIPQVKKTLNIKKNELVKYKFDDSTRREEMTQALKKTYYKSLGEERLESKEIKKDIDDHVFLRYNNTLCHYVPWVIKHFNLQGKDMLEIGSGTGSSTAAFAHFCNQIYAYEIIEKDVEASRERMRIMGINNVNITQVTPENSLSIIKKNHSDGVDVILLFAVLEHMKIKERLEVLSETWKLLNPNGILIITETPNRLTYYDHHTSWLDFFHMLPEDLAIEYYHKSPREDFKFSLNQAIVEKNISEGIETLIRWGNGVSFHEFEIALNADLNDLIIADGDDSLIRELFPVTLQEELLKDYFIKQKINQPFAFTNGVLNFILQKQPYNKN
jgi:S-adenosylmethionine-dependent methyltransferase